MIAYLLLLALQDDAAKAKELLDGAAAALKDARAIRFEFTQKWKGDVEGTMKGKASFQRPNLLRLEMTGEDQDTLTILDGKTYWMYLKTPKQYIKMDQSKGLETSLGTGIVGDLFFGSDRSFLADATAFAVKEEKLGEEKMQVVSWKARDSSNRVWIDAKKMVRRHEMKIAFGEETYDQNTEYGAIDLAPSLEKDAFTFTPPKDATEFKQEPDEQGLLDVGAPAPDFVGTDLDGKEVRLSGFKGKTVLLNFWFHG